MLLLRWLVPWALMASCVSAFLPYYPHYKCVEDGECQPGDPTAPGPSPGVHSRDMPTLRIKQRLPTDALPQEMRIDRYLKRLTKKFEASSNTVAKRSNQYTIATAVAPSQPSSAALDQDGTDFSYFAQVKFGSSSTPLYMLMDTGASATWVMGTSCTSQACTLHNTYGSANSNTFKASSAAFDISYGTGHVDGFVASDTVSFAGFSLSLSFGVANSTSDEFVHFPFDGIMGLARASGTYPTLIQAISTAKLFKSNIFGVNLDRTVDGTHDGEINFGAADTSKFTGSLSYTPLAANNGDWAIAVDGVSVGGKSAGITGRTAFIDTGTSYIFIPPDDAKALHSLIPGADLSGGSWNVPCSTTASLQFSFSGVSYSVPSKDWIGGNTTATLCASNIFPGTPVGANGWLMGDTFMKNVYTVFDADQQRIGFGTKTPSVAGSSTLSSPASSASSTLVAGTQTSNLITTGPSPTNNSNLTSAATNSGASGFNAAITSSMVSPAEATVAPSASSSKAGTSDSARSFGQIFMISIGTPFFIALILVA